MDRVRKIVTFFIILFVALVLRLAYIQLLGHEDLAEVAEAQSLITLDGSNTRGIIYDRNGAALVADEKHYIYIIKDNNFTKNAEEKLSETGAVKVNSENAGYKVYSSQNYNKNIGESLIKKNNAYILQASARYGKEQIAEHLIGYVNKKDQSGAAGLELMYDDILSGFGRQVYAVADVKGNILPGRGLLITSQAQHDSYVAEGIRTTIDKELQVNIEKIIEDEDGKFAVAVIDTATGGVKAMACTPGFDQNNVQKYMNSSGDELMNKVTQGEYPPGSIFKIVVAAAALERGIDISQTYECRGHAELNGMTVGCETGGEEGHGMIGFEEAFAVSCNSFFIQLGQEIGADEIIETAKKMGLGYRLLDGYPQERSGHLMSEEERAGNAIGNLCIGQGETLVTPLQAVAMVNIIASGGIDKGIHILMDDEIEENQVISKTIADTIADMMTQVVLSGTGSNMGISEAGQPKASIKTGTAEFMVEGGMTTHSWITGFAPCDDPEYTIVVFAEGSESDPGYAAPAFRKIIEYLEDSGSYNRPAFA